MEIACIDLESIPNQRIPMACIPTLDPEEVKYGNTKDPDKRQAILAEKQASFETGKAKKMGLDPTLAQVCTFVGIKYNTKSESVIEKVSVQVTKAWDADDLDAVTEGWGFLNKMYLERTPIVSFNGIGFDLPVLWHRAIAQDVPIDRYMYDRLMMKYNNPFHYDLLGILAGWTLDKMKGHPLEFFLNLYKIGTKGDMDGTKVYETWKLGEYDKIQQYCENDVLLTAKLFQRVESWIKIDRKEGI